MVKRMLKMEIDRCCRCPWYKADSGRYLEGLCKEPSTLKKIDEYWYHSKNRSLEWPKCDQAISSLNASTCVPDWCPLPVLEGDESDDDMNAILQGHKGNKYLDADTKKGFDDDSPQEGTNHLERLS